MLKYIFFLFWILGVNLANGQEFAYIDSEYILKNVPEYVQAKEKLDGLATKWTKEVEDRYAAIKAKKANFDREEVLLPKEEKKKKAGNRQT
jgi:Outer membrane protein (OmpH-like).